MQEVRAESQEEGAQKKASRRLSKNDAATADADWKAKENTQAHGPAHLWIMCVRFRLRGVLWDGGSLWRDGHS